MPYFCWVFQLSHQSIFILLMFPGFTSQRKATWGPNSRCLDLTTSVLCNCHLVCDTPVSHCFSPAVSALVSRLTSLNGACVLCLNIRNAPENKASHPCFLTDFLIFHVRLTLLQMYILNQEKLAVVFPYSSRCRKLFWYLESLPRNQNNLWPPVLPQADSFMCQDSALLQ